jgi:parvulin-like peptidyl-prolyl isomerase
VIGTSAGRWRGRVLAAAVGLVGCDRGTTSEAPAQTLPSAGEGGAAADGEAEGGVAAVDSKAGGGLVASVTHEVEVARERDALSAEARPPVVPPGAALVAVVAGVPVPRSAFDEVYALKVKKYGDRGRTIPPSADTRYRRSIVERLVYHEQLRQRVVQIGADFDPARLAARVEQQRTGIRDWDEHLERRGETEASLRAMLIAELREEVILERAGELAASRAEIEADYEAIKGNWVSEEPRIRASHILVPIEPAGAGGPAALEAAAKAEAVRIHALATAPGADFAAVARERSSGPSRSKGGDVGIFTAERMAEEFSKVAFAMKVGEVSKPVKTKFGFHIIHVTGKWPPGVLPIAALEDQIVERLRQRKLHAARRALQGELAIAYPVTHHLLTPEEQAAPRTRPGAVPTEAKVPEEPVEGDIPEQ